MNWPMYSHCPFTKFNIKALLQLYELLLYGIYEAVDGEKDPHCLLLAFDIIRALIQLFPDPNGPLENFSGELFETLSSYFPIHFTHPKGEDTDVKRDDLARALMVAFSSTPLLEPYVIPLLLENLSSSLPSSKVDSLKYLSYCSLKYGVDRMAKHAGASWSSIKSEMSTSVREPTEGVTSESINGLGVQENEIAAESLVDIYFRVKSLQILATFPDIVVEKIVSSLSSDKFTLPFPLKLEVVSELGASGHNHMLMIVQELEGAIFANLYDFLVHGNKKSAELAIQLLQCYSEKVIPWYIEMIFFEQFLTIFVVKAFRMEECISLIFVYISCFVFSDKGVVI
ncbi:MMS19 nucleotide excision repair protein homolog [Humulus lupulus]|uniref:MMS19 nucleotide excision repair protein homolog n=1 Tax=Humulus lupulus TaxID=3486 RepID=UPI002B4055EB|nr:MMS19 nucleotide excision repair protein homolog [Humulus lupulus]